MNRFRFIVFAVALIAVALSFTTHAQTYPSKPVRVIVPYPPGGAGDIIARTIGQKLSQAWGQQVVVENRPGAAGMIGAAQAAKSPADGYTLLLGYTAEIAINPKLYSKIAYDPEKELVPVAMGGILPLLLVSNPSLPVKSVKDIIALAKAKPNQVIYGSAGYGSPAHLGMEYLKRTAKVEITHVPYKGGAEVVTAIMTGDVMLFFSGIPPAIPFVNSGRLRALAVSTKNRFQGLPNIPTVAESGVPGFDLSGWFGYFVPTGTPQDMIEKLNSSISATLKGEDLAKQFLQQGILIDQMNPEQFGTYIRNETQKYARLIKESGARTE